MQLDYSHQGLESLASITTFKDELVIKLDIRGNKLKSLYGIERFPNLRTLKCGSNVLTSLGELVACPHLRKLDCSGNRLTSLQGIERCKNLSVLCCEVNHLTSLLELRALGNIVKLNCSSNRLSSLRGIENLSKLQELMVAYNSLPSEKVPEIVSSYLLYPKLVIC